MSPEQRKKLFVFILILLSFLFLLTFFSENSAGDERKYYTYDGVVNQINVWALEHGDIVKVSNLSEIYNVENTYQGRNLWVVRVSDENNAGENGEKESQVLFLGGFEGRNWLSVEISMDLLRTLVENYEKDERIRSLIENNEIYVVPVVNPDGFQYSREHDNASNEGEGGWVKNRNATKDFGVYGVNINRNFDILWRNDLESGINDTSGTPSDFSYAGESPESEYETKALIELIKDKNFSFVILFDEKGRRVMTIPFAKDKAPFAKDSTHLQNSTDEETLNMLADYLASFLNYTVVEENPYYISGDFLDWCYAEHKLLSLKIAVGDSFIPAESDISNITANYTEMCLNAVELSYYFKNLSYINSMENEEDWRVFSSQKVWSHILEEETSYDGKGYWGVEGFENHATGSLETESFINLEGLKNPKLSFFQR
ncbi:MAG TPA: hypothetical protein EYP29_05380, partial [Thermoplasmata archaeon]|nr:hypothetical protein [Thermoplasmata archaeon]